MVQSVDIAHLIQIALTPIFLISAIGVTLNVLTSRLARIVDRFSPEPEVAPDAPGAFRFATPGKLRRIVEEAGARDVSERLFRFTIDAPLNVEDYWTLRCDMAEKLRQRLAALPPEALIKVKKEVLDAFRPYVKGTGVSFPAEVLIVSGRKEP